MTADQAWQEVAFFLRALKRDEELIAVSGMRGWTFEERRARLQLMEQHARRLADAFDALAKLGGC